MWSVGCIVTELCTGRPLFPAIDENELIEFYALVIGLIPTDMVSRAKKKNKFFDRYGKIIKSRHSRIP